MDLPLTALFIDCESYFASVEQHLDPALCDRPVGVAPVPHMGWNSATATRGATRVWQGLGSDPYFYYIHSYYPEPTDSSSVVAVMTHGTQTFAGAVERGNLFACQFHPEKSQEAGLRLICNFLGI